MKLYKNFSTEQFSCYYNNNKNLPHFIKLVVDDVILDVNKLVLSCWSTEFVNRADDDGEIFLTEFIGKYFVILIKIILII